MHPYANPADWLHNLTRALALAAMLKTGWETKLLLLISDYREREDSDHV